MNFRLPWLLAAGLAAVSAGWAEETLDRVGEQLSFATQDGRLRARLSGLLDLEYYGLSQPSPGLLFTNDAGLFNPRASLFLDAQAGEQVYCFAQARVDRGFDPSEGGIRGRLDEYALRLKPVRGNPLALQLGKFATVFGAWVRRHDSWTNPFVGAPLAYENLTGMWDVAPVRSSGQLLAWAHLARPSTPAAEYADKHLRLPIVWGAAYGTGLAVSGRAGRLEFAAELKNAALSSRPDSWDARRAQWRHPAVAGRVGFRPNPMWSLGASAGTGAYLLPSAGAVLPAGTRLGDYRQETLGADASFEWHYWQVWWEGLRARFEIPLVGTAATSAWFVEVRRKLSPSLAVAARWNEHYFGAVPGGGGSASAWGRDCRRIEFAATFRISAHRQCKLQYSLQHEAQRSFDWRGGFALQFTARI
jgi:hypothetical protein